MGKILVHIAYGDSAAGCLRAAMKLGLPGESVIVSRDDFTQGPISDCIVDGGLQQRVQYWKNIKTLHASLEGVKDQYESTLKGINSISQNDEAVLWIGDSAHDRLATAWLISYLENKNINWCYVNLFSSENNLQSNVVNLAMLSPEQLLEVYHNIKEMSLEDKQEYLNLWSKLSSENKAYRIQADDKVISVDENYYDNFILSHLTKKEQLLGKVIGSIMKDGEHRLSDVTIESRLVALQQLKKIKIKSNLANVFLSKVKLK